MLQKVRQGQKATSEWANALVDVANAALPTSSTEISLLMINSKGVYTRVYGSGLPASEFDDSFTIWILEDGEQSPQLSLGNNSGYTWFRGNKTMSWQRMVGGAGGNEDCPSQSEAKIKLEVDYGGDYLIAPNESKVIKVFAVDSTGADHTSEVSQWSIVRESSNSDADVIWGQRDKVKNFDGTIELYLSEDVTINDIDWDRPVTRFHITATIGVDTLSHTVII